MRLDQLSATELLNHARCQSELTELESALLTITDEIQEREDETESQASSAQDWASDLQGGHYAVNDILHNEDPDSKKLTDIEEIIEPYT